jgi:hypothetical protein
MNRKERLEQKLAENLGLYFENGLWNSHDDVGLYNLYLTRLPLKFGTVNGDFDCSCNQLTSLEGAPNRVSGNFWCNTNKLPSLKGAPDIIGGYFNCRSNRLTDLEGAPELVNGDFYCEDNLVRLKRPEWLRCRRFYNE